MPEQGDRESYAILLGGGLVILALLLFASPPAPRSFYLAGNLCDPGGVMEWLRRKLNQGKITADDIQRLLNTSITFYDWITFLFGRRGFDISDVNELLEVCAPAAGAVTSSPYP